MRNYLDKILPVIILLILVCGCGFIDEGLKDNFGGYVVKDGKVTYHSGLEGLGSKRSWEIAEADADTFTSLKDGYGKDKKHAYLDGILIPDSDGATFHLLEKPYAADNAHVFIGTETLSDSPQTFKIIANLEKVTFSTDGKKVFSGGVEFLPETVDAATFERIDQGDYFRDRGHVYLPDSLVEGADPQTFHVWPQFNEVYAGDKNNVFYNGQKVEGCDAATHKVIDGDFHRDGKNIFYHSKRVSDDAENFQALTSKYSRDSKHVYWQMDKISDDPANFIVYPNEGWAAYAKDSRTVFRCGQKVKNVDVKTFSGLNPSYAKDKNNVYFEVSCDMTELSTVDGADPASFELAGGDGVDARDKDNDYNFGTNRGPHKTN
ncbi:MAG TPA: DKNYY domain-containing protein [Pyrinomonadaceae bacterium]|jgi:hypothetical protein|nr:DKNYY domain-containing protein [Pyrinomonadaceae bacterium]